MSNCKLKIFEFYYTLKQIFYTIFEDKLETGQIYFCENRFFFTCQYFYWAYKKVTSPLRPDANYLIFFPVAFWCV